MKCAGCKHWTKDIDQHDWSAAGAGMARCAAVRPRWKIQDEAVSGKIEHTDADDEYDVPPKGAWALARSDALKAAKAYVQDGSEYRAEFITGPDYFCALFETKS